jgi:hypothetical protein
MTQNECFNNSRVDNTESFGKAASDESIEPAPDDDKIMIWKYA